MGILLFSTNKQDRVGPRSFESTCQPTRVQPLHPQVRGSPRAGHVRPDSPPLDLPPAGLSLLRPGEPPARRTEAVWRPYGGGGYDAYIRSLPHSAPQSASSCPRVRRPGSCSSFLDQGRPPTGASSYRGCRRPARRVATSHSLLYLSLPLCIYLAENIQTSAGDHPSNTRECQTPHHRPTKTYFQLFLGTPTDSGQWNSLPSGSELHSPLSVGVAWNS